MKHMDVQQKVIILKSIADETRLSIVRQLVRIDNEVMGGDIVSDCSIALRLSQPTMSHHFQKLVTAGVLRERKSGVEKYYALNVDVLLRTGIDPMKL